MTRLLDLLATNRSWYENHPDDARAMAGDIHRGTDCQSVAALIATASIVLNLDEFITRE